MQRAARISSGKRSVGRLSRLQRGFRFDRHESVEARLPLRDPLQTGPCHLLRRQALLGDRFGDGHQRHQGRLGAHFGTFAACTSRKPAGSRSNGSVPAMGAKPSNAGPMEVAMRVATSASTGTPAASAIALIALGLGLVMPYLLRCLLLWPAPGCAPKPEWPCSTPPDGPLYRADKVLAWHLRRAAPQTDSGCETGSPWVDRSGSADRPRSAASLSDCPDRTTASL